MNEHDPSNGNFLEISKEELGSLFLAFADSLILHGEIEPNKDAILQQGDSTPYTFTYTVPNKVTKHIFYSHEDRIAPMETNVHYDQEHRIDDPPNDGVIRDLYVIIRSRLIEQDVFVNQVFRISQDDRVGPDFTADVDVQYTDLEGRNLSYSPIEETVPQEERLIQAAERYKEGLRPFMLEDVEMLRQLIDYFDGTLDNS